MILKKDASTEKLAGRYYTPFSLAQFIVEWGSEEGIKDILEPSCGDGVFLDALRELNSDFTCQGVEISEEEANKARSRLLIDERFDIISTDFYEYYTEHNDKKFDFIVGNPPYIRYQYLSEEQRNIQSDLLKQNGLKPNKLINSWVAFTIASISMLKENSKIGFVIPAELLQVKYAEQLRLYLMDQLNEITIITFNELIFDGIDQEVVVLLGTKKSDYKKVHQMKILEFDDVLDLNENFHTKNKIRKFQDIDTKNLKWTKYFLSDDENEVITNIRGSSKSLRFGDIAQVDVGITTGNNNYFCVNKKTAEEFDLLKISRPLIARSVNIPGITFEKEDWLGNVESGAKTYLVDFNNTELEAITDHQKRYIALGEANQEYTGYKCRIRKKWYVIPSIWVPDAFFLRRNYQYPKFVLNNCDAVSTDTMHRIRFLDNVDYKKAVLSYYNSISFAFTELEARSYGGGVLEILPRELENVTIPNIFTASIADDLIGKLFDELNKTIRKGGNIEDVLDLIDETLLVKQLELSPKLVSTCREIWHKLKDRRINRGANNTAD